MHILLYFFIIYYTFSQNLLSFKDMLLGLPASCSEIWRVEPTSIVILQTYMAQPHSGLWKREKTAVIFHNLRGLVWMC